MADTLPATQGAGDEVAKDEDKDMVYEDAHSLHLVGDLLHLDKNCWSSRHTLIK